MRRARFLLASALWFGAVVLRALAGAGTKRPPRKEKP